MTPDRPVNLYQSHEQSFTGYAMVRPPLKRSTSEDATGSEALARSLNKAFYVTSYQSEIARYAGMYIITFIINFTCICQASCIHIGAHRNSVSGDSTVGAGADSIGAMGPLCGNFETRRSSTPQLVSQRRKRVTSAPPIRTITTVQPSSDYQGPASRPPLQRRRSFTAIQQSFPSKGEMLKDIFTVYPAPQPQPVSKWRSRPSSAVTLRAGKIPSLRKANPWV